MPETTRPVVVRRGITRQESAIQVPHQKSAVLIDGSTLFLSARALYEGQLDYRKLFPVLKQHLPWLNEPSDENPWVMWTSASADNGPQSRFLEFAQRELRWEVRASSPAETYLIDPTMLSSIGPDHPIRPKLLRFDAAMAFALGRLSSDNFRCLVLSPSFQLAEPLRIVASVNSNLKPAVAFFGHGLDPRMQQFLTNRESPVDFVDLSNFADNLFSFPPARKDPTPPSTRHLVF